jgi:hypothetical protein
VLETLKKMAAPARAATDLEQLLTTARTERVALNVALSQASLQSGRLDEIERGLADLAKRVAAATSRVDGVTARASQLDERLTAAEALASRVTSLDASLADAERFRSSLPASPSRAGCAGRA